MHPNRLEPVGTFRQVSGPSSPENRMGQQQQGDLRDISGEYILLTIQSVHIFSVTAGTNSTSIY